MFRTNIKPATAAGASAGSGAIRRGAAVISTLVLVEAEREFPSITFRVNGNFPTVDGFPESVPLAGSRRNPVGSLPWIDHE